MGVKISSSTKLMQNESSRLNLLATNVVRRLLIAATMLNVMFPANAHADMEQGKRLYKENCTPCHGELGKGDGAGARSLPVRPADHTNGAVMNKHSDAFLRDVIAKGGSAMGLSAFMPSWQGMLKANDIQDLVSYVRSLAVPQKNGNSKP